MRLIANAQENNSFENSDSAESYNQQMLSNQLTYMLNFFDACGYNTGSSMLSSHIKTIISINFVQICLCILFASYKVRFVFIFYHSLRWIVFLNEIFQYFVALNTYLSIVCDSLIQRRKHKLFWEFVKSTNKTFAQQNVECHFRNFILKLAAFISLTILCTIIFMTNDFPFDSFYIVYNFLVKLCQLRVFYSIFCYDVLHFQLKMLHNQLKTIKNELNGTPQANGITTVRRSYRYIYEMKNLLNEIFGWSQVTTVLFCFYFLLTDLNWFLIHADQISTTRLLGNTCSIAA